MNFVMRQTSMKKSMNLIWVVGIPKSKELHSCTNSPTNNIRKKTCFLINNLNSSHRTKYVNPQKLHSSVQNAWEPPKLKKCQRNLVGDIND